jgi:hypothetical protein
MAHDVFISYSKRDKADADMICNALENRRLRCWIAPRDVRPGKTWTSAIVDAINESKVFVLVFSGQTNASKHVIREITRAAEAGVPIIPFRIEDTAPSKDIAYYISDVHWLDALTPPIEEHRQRLADIVEKMVNPDHPVVPAIPGESKKEAPIEPGHIPPSELRRRRSSLRFLPGRSWKSATRIATLAIVAAVIGGSTTAILLFSGGEGRPKTAAPSSEVTSGASSALPSSTPLTEGTELYYIHDVFVFWTLTGDLRTDAESNDNYLLSAFNMIMTENGVTDTTPTMQAWIGDAVDAAINAGVCTTREQCSFLHYPTVEPFATVDVEESYRRLWEHVNRLKVTELKPKEMVEIRLALIKAVGEERQKELIGSWNQELGV